MKISDGDLRGVLLNPTLNRRGQYICDCPFCGKEQHFYISKATQLWDCKKCGESGNIYKLLKFLDKTFLLAGKTIEDKPELKSIREAKIDDFSRLNDAEGKLPVISMPVGCKEVYDGYMRQRGMSKGEAKFYGMMKTRLLKKYENYLLMPVREDGEVRGWVGRYEAKKVPTGVLRYKNSPGVNFASLLYGYDEIMSGKTDSVILVEGIFDKIAVDRYLRLRAQEAVKCVATFGKKISEVQISKLVSKGVKRVILAYDFDAIKDVKRISAELRQWFFVSVVYTTKKDIDECTEGEALEVFSRIYDTFDFRDNVIGKIKR